MEAIEIGNESGEYKDASEANVRAAKVFKRQRKSSGRRKRRRSKKQ